MAEEDPGPVGNALARGMFGGFQAGSAGREDTASVWSRLRETAASWQFAAQGREQPYDPAELQSAGREILRAQGINVQVVNTFRGLAGQWRAAKEALNRADPDTQIVSGQIFRPPWSTTASDAVPTRYRLRTQWQFQTTAGDAAEVWKTDEITAPLTTIGDALSQASIRPDITSPPLFTMAASPPVMTDYQLEIV